MDFAGNLLTPTKLREQENEKQQKIGQKTKQSYS